MKDKVVKLLSVVFVMLSILFISNNTYARSVSSIDKLGNLIDVINPDAETAFVIGNYVFTSTHTLTTEDIMLAARSIDVKNKEGKIDTDEIYKEMTINLIQKKYNEDTFEPEGWEVIDNVSGKTKLFEEDNLPIDIRYIDYDYIYDELDTDTLLENSAKSIKSNEFYSAEFDKENREVIFNVYDRNKKNSEISSTGLISSIVNIVNKDEKVKSLTINEVTFTKEDVKDGSAGPESGAWKKFAELLCKLTGKGDDVNTENALAKFKDITLGDLADIKDELKLTVTLDETKARSQNYKTSEEYTIKFVYEPHATISIVPETEVEELKSTFNYTPENTYKLENKNENYEVSGYVTEQEGVNGFGDKKIGFYFAYTITLNEGLDLSKVKVKVPKVPNPTNDSDYNIVEPDSNNVTVLMEVEEKEETRYRDIIVEVDGVSTKIRIDFTNLKLEKNSKFEIIKDLPVDAAEQIKSIFKGWGFEPEKIENFEEYNKNIKIEQKDKNNVEISGLLPLMKLTSATGFGEDTTKNDGYYIVYVIKTEKSVGKTDEDSATTYKEVTVKVPQNGEDGMNPTKIIKQESFDTDHELAILMKIEPKTNTEDQKFKVIVDMDGDKTDCAPYEITVDYSGIEFQNYTETSITIGGSEATSNIPTEDIKILKEEWGYQFPDDVKLENKEENSLAYDSTTGMLTGTIKEQKLTGGFEEDELDSYFFTYTIKPEIVTENTKVTVTSLGNDKSKVFTKQDFTGDVLTVLQHIPTDFVKCTEEECCKDGKCENPEKCKKAIKITVDVDGDGDNHYKDEVYYIDYCNADFVKLHTVTFKDYNTDGDLIKDVYDGENLQKPEDPVKKDDLDDNQYNTFDHWYVKESENNKEFKFEENDKSNDTITEDLTLYPIWEVDVDQYIADAIRHINESANSQDKFTIEQTTEDDKNTLKVDIEQRDTKIDDISDTSIASTIAHALASGEVDSINLELKNQDPKLEKEFKLETIKKELNKDGDCTEQDIKGKVSEELKKFITEKILSNVETNKTLDELYKKCNGKELELIVFPNKDVAKFEGMSEGAGKSYNIKFEEELIVTFEAGALENPKTEYVKTGGNIDNLPTPQMSEEEQKYRTFDGWYKDSDSKVDNLTNVQSDTTLTAHYTLNVDKFVEEVVEDLNKKEETDYSDNFDGKFNLEKEKNNITINIDTPKVNLTELANTSIPGTIAYILQRGEIKDITLAVGDSDSIASTDKKVEFSSSYTATDAPAYDDSADRDNGLLGDDGVTLKKEIVKGAKKVFNDELSEKEDSATLDQLEYNNKLFTIKLGSTEDTVKLVKGDNEPISVDSDKTYTFKFDSDFAVVKADNDDLGANNINSVLDTLKLEDENKKKDYKTIYIDGDVTESKSVTIDSDIAIKPIESAEKEAALMTVAEAPKHTITVNNQEYAIDVQKGNVTISDLKITGGTKSELKIEDNTNVTVNNIDVSGNITQATSREEEMNASIIVKGNLTATNVKNDNESYELPTIAVITDYAHPNSKDPEHAEDTKPTNHLSTNATVKADSMTVNKTYCLVDKTENPNFHYSKETYYGSFYYNNPNNSKIYFMGVMDSTKDAHPYDYIQIYYYDDQINIENLGYKPGEQPLTESGDVFTHFYIGNDENNKITDNEQKAQDKLGPHTTTVLHAVYAKQPVATYSIDGNSGLSTSGNKVSGTISTQNKDGKFVIPVTLTSEKFKDNTSTVTVTDPNGKPETYTYNSNNENGIATVSNANTMKLELEAIKTSKITGNKGKVYEITVDIDGKEKDEYQQETYTVDYSDVETLEEKINKAAKATLEANSFTVTKNNKINGYTEEFTYKYNANDGLTYLKSNKGDNVEEYTFSVKYADVAQDSSKLSVVARKKIADQEDSGVYLNDWVYVHPQQVGSAIHEVSMLTDVMEETSINAIDKVEADKEKQHTYTVKLNRDKYNDWVTKNYLSNPSYASAEWALNETVTVEVVLDDNEQYIKSIKTSQANSNNTFDVTFENVNSTTIEVPTKFLAEKDKTLKDEDIKKFYEAGNAWWEKHIYEDAYKQQ